MDQQILHDQKISSNTNRICLFLTLFLSVISLTSYSQTNFSMGVSGGYDKTFNHLIGLNKTNTDAFPDYNIGADGILSIGDRIRIRAALHYSNLGFTRNYNVESTNPQSLNISKLAISNLDISPMFDYRIATTGKLDFYASAGFRFEFQLGKYERSFKVNGESMENNYVSDAFTQTQAGAVGGLLLKYNLSQYTAITLAPEYTCFFDYFSTKNENWMQRVGVNLGIEWKF